MAPVSIVSSVVPDFCRPEIVVNNTAMKLCSLFLKRISFYMGKLRLLYLKNQQWKLGTIFTKIHRDRVIIRIFQYIRICEVIVN